MKKESKIKRFKKGFATIHTTIFFLSIVFASITIDNVFIYNTLEINWKYIGLLAIVMIIGLNSYRLLITCKDIKES